MPEVKALYAAALQDIEALGATLVPDPFAPGTFSDALDVSPLALSAAGFDFSQYLKASFGIESFDEFVAIAGANPATPDGALGFVYDALVKGPDGEPDPSIVPDLAPFRAAQARYLRSFVGAFDRLDLDALVFPTLRILQPPITEEGRPPNVLTATPEINIMGAHPFALSGALVIDRLSALNALCAPQPAAFARVCEGRGAAAWVFRCNYGSILRLTKTLSFEGGCMIYQHVDLVQPAQIWIS